MVLPGVYTPASIALKVTVTRKPPLDEKAVVLEEGIYVTVVLTF
jgi:hypothetical protein